MRVPGFCLMVLLGTLVAFEAEAKSVFLNGVNIDTVRNKTIKNCDVQIDAQGNVVIIAKGYEVKGGQVAGESAQKPKPVGGDPTKKYFLVTEKAAPGLTQYNIQLFINGKWIRNFLSEEDHIVFEVTKYLKRGPNKVRLTARKDIEGTRRSQSAKHYFRLVIGEGNAGGRNVMITKKKIDYRRNANEMKTFTDEYTMEAE